MARRRTETAATLFLDRDGVLCENRDDYVKSWSEFVFIPGAVDACAALTRAGCRLFVVTNQSAVGRGILARRTLEGIHASMREVLSRAGARIEEVLVCPHAPDDGCHCRKPASGLIDEAVERFAIDRSRAWMVGDAAGDVEAGRRAGVGTVLVLTGHGAGQARGADWNGRGPDFVAHDLVDAGIWVLAQLAARGAPLEVKSP